MKPLQERKKLLCLDLSYFVWFNDFLQKYDDYMYFSVKPMTLVISILFIVYIFLVYINVLKEVKLRWSWEQLS